MSTPIFLSLSICLLTPEKFPSALNCRTFNSYRFAFLAQSGSSRLSSEKDSFFEELWFAGSCLQEKEMHKKGKVKCLY